MPAFNLPKQPLGGLAHPVCEGMLPGGCLDLADAVQEIADTLDASVFEHHHAIVRPLDLHCEPPIGRDEQDDDANTRQASVRHLLSGRQVGLQACSDLCAVFGQVETSKDTRC